MSLALQLERLKLRKPRPMTDTRRVYLALQKAGGDGITGSQLGRMVPRYSTRISDLRADGHDILCVRHGRECRFYLRDES